MTTKKKTTHNPPSFLDPVAKNAWKARINQLLERGDIQEADLIHLELYCVNYSLFRSAVADIAKNGFSIVNSQGTQSRNPALSAKSISFFGCVEITAKLRHMVSLNFHTQGFRTYLLSF